MTDTTEQQTVKVAQEDREAAQIIANLGPDILRGIYREDFARLLARHRLASLPCKSGEPTEAMIRAVMSCACASDERACAVELCRAVLGAAAFGEKTDDEKQKEVDHVLEHFRRGFNEGPSKDIGGVTCNNCGREVPTLKKGQSWVCRCGGASGVIYGGSVSVFQQGDEFVSQGTGFTDYRDLYPGGYPYNTEPGLIGQMRRSGMRDAQDEPCKSGEGAGERTWNGMRIAPQGKVETVLLKSTPEPVPATNQAGEVEHGAEYIAETLRLIVKSKRVAGPLASRVVQSGHHLADLRRAALATQPATSQEGEARPVSEAIRKAKEHAGRVLGISWCNLEEISRVELILAELDRLAATPTPPTISEDLREALKPFADIADFYDSCEQHPNGCPDSETTGEIVDLTVGDFRRARAALAQVKAS